MSGTGLDIVELRLRRRFYHDLIVLGVIDLVSCQFDQCISELAEVT